jgi:hypothetical protein
LRPGLSDVSRDHSKARCSRRSSTSAEVDADRHISRRRLGPTGTPPKRADGGRTPRHLRACPLARRPPASGR